MRTVCNFTKSVDVAVLCNCCSMFTDFVFIYNYVERKHHPWITYFDLVCEKRKSTMHEHHDIGELQVKV